MDRKGQRIKGRSVAQNEQALKSGAAPPGRRRHTHQEAVAGLQERRQSQSRRHRDLQPPARHDAGSRHSAGAGVRNHRHRPRKASHAEARARDQGRIEGGTSLHEALAKHPLYFDDLFVNLVEAGEQAGALEGLLDKIATYKEKSEAVKKKVKKALFYPAAVLVVAVIVTVILLMFVIPQFEELFKGFGADLPAFTQMVINLSKFVQHNGIYHRGRRRRRNLRVYLLSRSARARCVSSSTACR